VVEGVPLARLHAVRLRAAGFSPILVVRPEDARLFAEDGVVVISEEPDQAGSLARGASALSAERSRSSAEELALVLVTPVDALPPEPATLGALEAALAAEVDAVVPAFDGRRGHPVLLRRRVLDPYARGERPPLRDVLAELGDRRRIVEVRDPRVVTDLDDRERVTHATGAPPRFV
jgi:CTP:molybdopterin cytidylyltransferase MocA